MSDLFKPFLVLYVVWHPNFDKGPEIAESLREHFRRKIYENIAGGAGISVIFRYALLPNATTPIPIPFQDAETTAIVVLMDEMLANDNVWIEYIRELTIQADHAGLGVRVFPVALDSAAVTKTQAQAIRWDLWSDQDSERRQKLIRELTYEFCRMLRHYLEHLRHPTEEHEALEAYLKKARIFLSHSKHDPNGEKIARAIRNRLHGSKGPSSFFDVTDIPAGMSAEKVLVNQVRTSAVVAIYTDSYSSREWCRREIIEAKRWSVPMVIANCIDEIDDRGFPYMGNVPVIRMDPGAMDRIDAIVGRLLDELLKDFLWRCRVLLADRMTNPAVAFVPRPPELISLVAVPKGPEIESPVLVYPDPPISVEEGQLFTDIAPHVRLLSMTEWLAGIS